MPSWLYILDPSIMLDIAEFSKTEGQQQDIDQTCSIRPEIEVPVRVAAKMKDTRYVLSEKL